MTRNGWDRTPVAAWKTNKHDADHRRKLSKMHLAPDSTTLESQAFAPKIQADDALDREGARQVGDVSRKLFEQTGEPHRVTISKILPGLSTPVASTAGNRERYPLLFAAIDLCKETAWCFSARRILWALGELDRFEETITIGNIVLRSARNSRREGNIAIL
jgi:hypothetical protein